MSQECRRSAGPELTAGKASIVSWSKTSRTALNHCAPAGPFGGRAVLVDRWVPRFARRLLDCRFAADAVPAAGIHVGRGPSFRSQISRFDDEGCRTPHN